MMRRRGRIALAAAVMTCGLTPTAAMAAEEYLEPYRAVADALDAGALEAEGVDLEHAGYDTSKSYAQPIQVALLPSQAERLEDKGVELDKLAVAKAAPKALRLAEGGDSPNPFYTVYRQYMEPGGILDEMEQ